MRVPVTILVFCLVGYSFGKKCPPIACPAIPCVIPEGCELVEKPCACCPDVCALQLGQACGSYTQPCESDLWCAKEKKGKLVAYKKVPWFINFKGVCTKITTCTK